MARDRSLRQRDVGGVHVVQLAGGRDDASAGDVHQGAAHLGCCPRDGGDLVDVVAEPASTQPVTPSCRSNAGPSLLRPAWVWISISPGATILPRASIVWEASAAMSASTATILPPAIATSRIASSPAEGSMTRPPLMRRS